MHFIHLFSILLPVCFNKFSVQCSVFIHSEPNMRCDADIRPVTRGVRGDTSNPPQDKKVPILTCIFTLQELNNTLCGKWLA